MKEKAALVAVTLCLVLLSLSSFSLAAYNHAGELDAPVFLQSYSDKAGTKLDNCALCHTAGTVVNGTKTTTYGSCQWCHLKYGYTAPHGDITLTLNPYGAAYLANGRNAAALKTIELLDSDGDGYTNIAEINAVRYPGSAEDDPTKVIAPFRIFSKSQLRAMPQHKQFMLMNTTKSGDYYAEYTGVIMQDILKKAGIVSTATKITVYAPDGYSQGHPLEDSSTNTGAAYAPFVNGVYPPATYFYNVTADKKKTASGWCNYSSAGNNGRKNGDSINVDGGLRLLLALQADGMDLVPGKIGPDNKLLANSEGPFRVITPQKFVNAPDQASTSTNQSVIWPYVSSWDHNAGYSSKSATIIKVEPLPSGTTDINVYEAGWNYIDQEKLVIYGALEGVTLVSPTNGMSSPVNGTILTWNNFSDPDPAAAITYTVEISKDKIAWTSVTTQVSSAFTSEKTLLAGAGKYMLLGFIGTIAVGVPRRSRKYLGFVLVIALMGTALSSCSNDATTTPKTTSATVPAANLTAGTKYYWRVTADGPNSHAISEVNETSTFVTSR